MGPLRPERAFSGVAGGQLFVAGDEIGVQVGLEDVADADAVLLGRLQVNLDITLRIDDDGLAFRCQQVGGVGQTSQVELFEVHGFSRAQHNNRNFRFSFQQPDTIYPSWNSRHFRFFLNARGS